MSLKQSINKSRMYVGLTIKMDFLYISIIFTTLFIFWIEHD